MTIELRVKTKGLDEYHGVTATFYQYTNGLTALRLRKPVEYAESGGISCGGFDAYLGDAELSALRALLKEEFA